MKWRPPSQSELTPILLRRGSYAMVLGVNPFFLGGLHFIIYTYLYDYFYRLWNSTHFLIQFLSYKVKIFICFYILFVYFKNKHQQNVCTNKVSMYLIYLYRKIISWLFINDKCAYVMKFHGCQLKLNISMNLETFKAKWHN